MSILKKLYYGNISPNEKPMRKGSELEKATKLIVRNEKDLPATLNNKQKKSMIN